MRVSNLFGLTLRELPADVDIASHQLLLRAGYVRQLAAGIFSLLPLAQRSMRKIEDILRQEMDAIGGQEVSMPVVHPAEIWQKSGRWDEIDDTMARFVDRRGRDMLLAMTHEEVVGELCVSEINSYRQMPALVYQLQTKFRDEPRARGGLIRVREFTMKDSYSLDVDDAGLHEQYKAHYTAYFRIGARVALPLLAVRSDTGMMGGKVAHEFMYEAPIGEDNLAICDSCGYSANREVAEFVKPEALGTEAAELSKVATPDAKTIEDLCSFLEVGPEQIAKTVFLAAEGGDGPARLVLAVVRGDMDVNIVAVRNHLQAADVRAAHEEEIVACGAVPGYGSPIGIDRSKALVLVDELVAASSNLVMGANDAGHHYLNGNHGRDFEGDQVLALAGAFEGAGCVTCGAALRMTRGVEVGNIFKLGTRYSKSMGAHFTDEAGQEQPIVMGSYGIGVGRLLACIAEEHFDERGLVLPMSIAPFQVCLVSLARKEPAKEVAAAIYAELQGAGVEVLFDDRDVSAGIKMTEADLRGIPLRLVVSERSIKNGGAELKARSAADGEIIPRDEVVTTIRQRIADDLDALRQAADQSPLWTEGDD